MLTGTNLSLAKGGTKRAPEQEPSPPAATVDWAALVDQVRTGHPTGMEQLYKVFSKGVRFYFCRQLGPQELEDKVHDTFVIVVQAIQNGELREPDRLMGFVRTIVRRQVAAHIETAIQVRKDLAEAESTPPAAAHYDNPEDGIIQHEREKVMLKVLNSMSQRDREVLTRFYLREQTQEEICQEMGLTETQFRLLKSRAKARFGELGRKSIQKRRYSTSFFVRTLASSHH